MTSKPDESDPEWDDWFAKKMGEASQEEEAFWERRRRLGLGVGLDEHGNLVYGEDLLPDGGYAGQSLAPKG